MVYRVKKKRCDHRMKNGTTRLLCLFCIVLLFFVLSCGCGGGSVTSLFGQNPNNPGNGQTGDQDDDEDWSLHGTLVREGAGRASALPAAGVEPGHISNPVPLAGATVTFTPASGAVVTFTTGADGTFSIAPGRLAAGVYRFTVAGGGFSDEFYLKIEGDELELLSEFAASGDCYTTIEKPDDPGGWTTEIEPDGTYTIERNGEVIEQHYSDGMTVVRGAGGAESWTLDGNANFTDDTSDPDAPALTSQTDSDGDGCHNMRDFDDADSDNDGAANRDDADYNTNLLAGSVLGISTNCVMTAPIYAIELVAEPAEGGAPLTVEAHTRFRGDPAAIEKFVWTTGIPGAEPIETAIPKLTITYEQYGAYILTVVVTLTTGEELVDTFPILVVDRGNTDQLVHLTDFDAQCSGGDLCYTMDVDVDQYGNLFVLIHDFLGDPQSGQVGIYDPSYDLIDTIDTPHPDQYGRSQPLNIAVDENGFIYVLDSWDTGAVLIYDSLGRKLDEISMATVLSGESTWATLSGIAVNDGGDFFVGHAIGAWDEIIHCTKSSGYQCEIIGPLTMIGGGLGAVFNMDVELTGSGDLAVLYEDKLYYYRQDGTYIKACPLVKEDDVEESLAHLALGPRDEIYIAGMENIYGRTNIYVYNSECEFQYSFSVPYELLWDTGVDQLGKLYIAAFSAGIISVYAPEYLVNQSAESVAARAARNGGFNVRPVRVIRLK